MCFADEDGNWPSLKDGVKWLADAVVKPVVKEVQKMISKHEFTYSTGYTGYLSTGIFSFSAQGGISMDAKGNVALQGTFMGGVSSNQGILVTSYETRTNAHNINNLNGFGYQIGGSYGFNAGYVPVTVGADINIIPDSKTGQTYWGISNNGGIGTPRTEVHIEWGDTATWKAIKFNVYDIAKHTYIKIMEW